MYLFVNRATLNRMYMIQFQKITSVHDPLFSTVYNLYCNAFPANERRTWEGLEFELTYQKQFFANAIFKEEKVVGLLHFWTFDQFYYIEHLAINPAFRGQNIGTEVMTFFKSKSTMPIVLEVELPNSAASVRRIAFYQKLGFTILNENYIQPPYEPGGTPVPMHLMTDEPAFAELYFDLIRETLYEKVYHVQMLN